MNGDLVRARVLIEGRVQGVFFRASTRDEARRLGLNGWVRNLPNGDVEALIEGEKGTVNRLLAWCHHGPPYAAVSKVSLQWEPYQGDQKGFQVAY
jgi:acylphosphatase